MPPSPALRLGGGPYAHKLREERSPEMPSGLYAKLLCRVLAPLALGYGVCLVDRINMSMAQLQMAGELRMSQAAFGVAASSFFITYTALQVPANFVLARVGAKRCLTIYLVCWGTISAAHGLVQNVQQLVVLRVALGVFEAGFFPGCVYFLTRWFPPHVAAQVNALLGVGAGALSGVFFATSGLIMDLLDGVGGLGGWRWLFLVQGLPGLPMGAALWLLMDESPARARWLRPEEAAFLLRSCADPELAANRGASLWRALLEIFSLPTTVVFGLTWLSTTLESYSLAFYDPRITKDVLPDWSATKIGLVGALPMAIQIVGSPLIARWADGGGAARKAGLVWGLASFKKLMALLAALPLLLASERGEGGEEEGVFYWIVTRLGLVWVVSAAEVMWAIHHRVQPAHLLPISIAAVNMFGQLGGLLGPSTLGILHDYFSPPCPQKHELGGLLSILNLGHQAPTPASCAAQWGWPLVLLYGSSLLAFVLLGFAALRLGLASETEGRAPPRDGGGPALL